MVVRSSRVKIAGVLDRACGHRIPSRRTKFSHFHKSLGTLVCIVFYVHYLQHFRDTGSLEDLTGVIIKKN